MKSDSDFSLESRLASLAQPDTLLPSQYLATVCRDARLEPEKKLMLAVLEDGVLCFQRYFLARDSKGESLFHDAESWILEQNDDRIFSFENLCEVLGLDPKYVRQGLLHWKERKMTEHRARRLPFDLRVGREKNLARNSHQGAKRERADARRYKARERQSAQAY